MSSIGETKKLMSGIATSIADFSKHMDQSLAEFLSAKSRAERIVSGTSSDVEREVIGMMQRAHDDASLARENVRKASEVCAAYAAGTL
jgi:hypothetical protein